MGPHGELRFWYLTDTPSVHPAPPGSSRASYFTTVSSTSAPLSWTCAQACASAWQPIGLDDMDGDGEDDVLWFNRQTGQVSAWLMHGTTVKSRLDLATRCDPKAGCTSNFRPIGVITGTPGTYVGK